MTAKHTLRFLRPRVVPSKVLSSRYTISNKITATHWPPRQEKHTGAFTWERRKTLMHHLDIAERQRMDKEQIFKRPNVETGDLVEVRYELSRTQQSQAVFQGYCIEVRKKGLNSAIILKNTYDGVGVTQGVPIYSPRLLSIRVIKEAKNALRVDEKPLTKDYRYKWHTFTKSPREAANLSGLHKPGIRSLEPRIARRICRLRRKYMDLRRAAGLPGYTFSARKVNGATRDLRAFRCREIRAEMNRRLKIYTHDAKIALARRSKRKRKRAHWGYFKLGLGPRAETALPSYHPLLTGNLPI